MSRGWIFNADNSRGALMTTFGRLVVNMIQPRIEIPVGMVVIWIHRASNAGCATPNDNSCIDCVSEFQDSIVESLLYRLTSFKYPFLWSFITKLHLFVDSLQKICYVSFAVIKIFGYSFAPNFNIAQSILPYWSHLEIQHPIKNFHFIVSIGQTTRVS